MVEPGPLPGKVDLVRKHVAPLNVNTSVPKATPEMRSAHPSSVPSHFDQQRHRHPFPVPSPLMPTRPPGPCEPMPEKERFMAFFNSLYDRLEASRVLESQLGEQVRKSTTLLNTLSSSGAMIESLVKSHFRKMHASYTDTIGAALTDLHRRLSAIETHFDESGEKPGVLAALNKRMDDLEARH